MDLPAPVSPNQKIFVSTASLFRSSSPVALVSLASPVIIKVSHPGMVGKVATDTGVAEIKGCGHHQAGLCLREPFQLWKIAAGTLHREVPHWAAQPGLGYIGCYNEHVPIRDARVPVTCKPEALLCPQLWDPLGGLGLGATRFRHVRSQ